MIYEKGSLLYEGKAKKIFSVFQSKEKKIDPAKIWIEYKDDMTAFNALKKDEIKGKGAINLEISSLLFCHLEKESCQRKLRIPTHRIQNWNAQVMIAHKLEMIPLEVVVRNVLAGSLAKKLGREEGALLSSPIVEFYLKDDLLGDPFLSSEQILSLEIAKELDLEKMKELVLQINLILKDLFKAVQIQLVDFKVEFGLNEKGDVVLGDEISPDCMRLWDAETKKRLDKDLFRRDLGDVKVGYEIVKDRLKKYFNELKEEGAG